MKIHALVEVAAGPQRNVVRKAQPHAVFDGADAVHLEHEPVEHGPQSHADEGGNAADHSLQQLFQHIAAQIVGLPANVELELADGRELFGFKLSQ